MTVFASMLNQTGTVERRRKTGDGQGGWSTDYVEIGSEPLRIRPASSTERETAQREEREITHVAYATYGADIQRGDRVTVRDLVVEILAVREPSLAEHHLEIDCLEKQVEATEEGGS